MQTITLNQVLPRVFAGMEDDGSIAASEVWLRSVAFERGCRTLVAAESGGGKSSLLSFLFGRRTDDLGSIAFDGNDISALDTGAWCALRSTSLSLLPQEMNLFGEITALENVLVKNRLTGFRSPEWIMAAFAELEIDNRANTLCSRMSVGQQQRVAIIRALCQPFDFLLLDEPVSHLDPRTNAKAAALIEREASALSAGIIVTSVGNPLSLDYTKTLRL